LVRLGQVLAVVFSVGLTVFIVAFRDRVGWLEEYGYLGAFIISALASATIVLPAPGWLSVMALAGVLNPFWVGVSSALGGTLGEMNGYLLGCGGRAAVEKTRGYARVEGWMKRWGSWTIFVLAVIPNPLFDVAGMASGALRFPLWKFILFGGAGRVLKHLGYAYFGAWVLDHLPSWFS
jgi:membrane protein YqaA with SNARE-associated domain